MKTRKKERRRAEEREDIARSSRAGVVFSRHISVRVVLCENAEGSVRVWDLDDRVREWGVREFGRDISVRGERDEDD